MNKANEVPVQLEGSARKMKVDEFKFEGDIDIDKANDNIFTKSKVKEYLQVTDLLSFAAMSTFLVLSVSIAGIIYALTIGENKEISDQQEQEFRNLAEKQARLLELINSDKKILNKEELNGVVLKLTSEQESNKKMIQQQNRKIQNAQTNLSQVKEINKNMSQEYNQKFDVVLESQNKINQSFSKQKEELVNLVDDVNDLESEVFNELDEQKKEYKEINQKQEDTLKNLTNTLKQQKNESFDSFEETLDVLEQDIEVVNKKQIDIEQSLNETQEKINNQSQKIKVLQKSVDKIDEEVSCVCKNGPGCSRETKKCVCDAGYFGDMCEQFNCTYKTTTVLCTNASKCHNVPIHSVATSHGSGNNMGCQFPFTFGGKAYGHCIKDNSIGPPFACGVGLGETKYVDLGEWSPGSIYTVEVWVKKTSITSGRKTVAGGVKNCQNWGIVAEDSFWGALYTPRNSCEAILQSNNTIQTHQWYHVVTTCDGQVVKLYVDGEFHKSAVVEDGFVGTNAGFYVGKSTCCDEYFEGLLKSLRVWNKALTQNEIQNIFKSETSFYKRLEEEEFRYGLLGYWDFDNIESDTCTGTDHKGKDWIPEENEEISGTHCNIAHFHIPKQRTIELLKWNGTTGGRIEINAKFINIIGTLEASGKGYRGGQRPTRSSENGYQGESFSGSSSASRAANYGGGGGGGRDVPGTDLYGRPGGGGGYMQNGGICGARPYRSLSMCGFGGTTYGNSELTVLYMGSGGGSGGNDDRIQVQPNGGEGGSGGGALKLNVKYHLNVTGYIKAKGGQGMGDAITSCTSCPVVCDISNCVSNSRTACWDWSGSGGGGSGGSIYINGQILIVESTRLLVAGGLPGFSGGQFACRGGYGGKGRTRLNYNSVVGSQSGDNIYTQDLGDLIFSNEIYSYPLQVNRSLNPYGNEIYLGCYEDRSQRHLSVQVGLSAEERQSLTNELCFDKCASQGYDISGIEGTDNCFCDNTIGTYPQLEDNDHGNCTLTCPGNSEQYCGGTMKLTVFGRVPKQGTGKGVFRTCDPWCITGSDSNGQAKWSTCAEYGLVSGYKPYCECLSGHEGTNCKADGD